MNRFVKSFMASAVLLGSISQVSAQEMVEIVVKGDLGSLPGESVKSVFGFNKSILETPRSASTISEEMMDRFNMQDIDELVALAPGSFTQSFFGVAGGLDVRGTPGETYFRGVRRLDNPGNYPTPIGASDRVDIVRGPASPIYGPSKIGGYLNFNPKSARIEETGQFIEMPEGSFSYTTGSWGKSIVTAEVGGPATILGRDLGYYVYTEVEDSDSYYDNSGVEQNLFQTSFDMDITDRVRLQFGGMYHDYSGNQVAGWNRITQDLIDNGTYITGSPASLDVNGDGKVSHQEYDTDGSGFTNFNPFRFDFLSGAAGGALTPGSVETLADLEVFVGDTSALALINPGLTKLKGNQVLVDPEDLLENTVTTLYFDVIVALDNDWEIKNQLFYESYDNLNENAYGFSQFHESWVVENKVILSKTYDFDSMSASVQVSPSIRHTDFEHGDDYTNEYFGRRDLSQPQNTALSTRVLATQIDDDYTEYYIGEYTNLGFAVMGDFVWNNGLSILAGVRYDTIDMESRQPEDQLLFASSNNFCPVAGCADLEAKDDVDGVSWTFSMSYDTPIGLIPYVTASTQSTMIVGQGAEVTVKNILRERAFDESELIEAGIKGSLLDNALYFAISGYKQERTDFSAQSIVTNQSTETEGAEVEVRWVVNEKLLLTLGYSNIKVTNLNTQDDGYRFSFIGCEDLPNIPCSALLGGQLGGNVSAAPSNSRRSGMPENILSFTGTYDFGNGWTVNGSVIDVEETYSGFSNSIELPSYTLVNLGFSYAATNWVFSVNGKNLTDETYFRANFPNLFGSTIVLPELPRSYTARIQYNF
tara:strand:+ start:1007 stop:3457 length:2451 start_codon:yes stop_codon:yes gene_type:complete